MGKNIKIKMIAQNVFSKEDHVDNVENEEDYKEYNYF